MSRVIMTASLDRLRLGNLLQWVLGEGLTGTVHLRWGGASGRILMQEGQLVGASLFELRGQDALLSLMMWSGGELTLEEGPVEEEGALPLDALTVMLEALRLQDHWDDLADRQLICTQPAKAEGPLAEALKAGQTVVEAALNLRMPPLKVMEKVEELLEHELFSRGRHKADKRILRDDAVRLAWLEAPAPATSEKLASGPASSAPPTSPVAEAPTSRSAAAQRGSATSSAAAASPSGSIGESTTSRVPNRSLQQVLEAASAVARPAPTPPNPARGGGFSLLSPVVAPPPPSPTTSVLSPTPTVPAVVASPTPFVATSGLNEEQEHQFYRLLDQGRQSFKAGQLDDAARFWKQAAGINPEDRTLRQNMRILELRRPRTA